MSDGAGQALINVAVIAGALVTIAAATKVPPFKQILRFFWCHLVSEPIAAWGRREGHEIVCPIIKESVAEAVPLAVAAAVTATVEPAIGVLRTELREHMDEERGQLTAADAGLAEHWAKQDVHDERVEERLCGIDERLGGIDAKIDAKIDAPRPDLQASITLREVPPGEVPPAG